MHSGVVSRIFLIFQLLRSLIVVGMLLSSLVVLSTSAPGPINTLPHPHHIPLTLPPHPCARLPLQSPLHIAGALLVQFKWDLNRIVEEYTVDPAALLTKAGFPDGVDARTLSHVTGLSPSPWAVVRVVVVSAVVVAVVVVIVAVVVVVVAAFVVVVFVAAVDAVAAAGIPLLPWACSRRSRGCFRLPPVWSQRHLRNYAVTWPLLSTHPFHTLCPRVCVFFPLDSILAGAHSYADSHTEPGEDTQSCNVCFEDKPAKDMYALSCGTSCTVVSLPALQSHSMSFTRPQGIHEFRKI